MSANNSGPMNAGNEVAMAADSSRSDDRPAVYHWLCLFLFVTGAVVSAIDRHLIGVIVEPMKAALGLSDTQVGLLQGFAFAFCYAVAALPIAWAVDRNNRVQIVAACITIWSLGTALSGIARNYTLLLTGRTLTALSEAGYSPGVQSILSDLFPRKRVAQASALFMVAPSLGLGLALIGGGTVLHHFQEQGGLNLPLIGQLDAWQSVLVIGGTPGLLLAAIILLIVREPTRRHYVPVSSLTSEQARSAPLRETFRQLGPFFACYTLGCTFVLLIMFALAAWSSTFFVREFGLEPASASQLIGPLVLVGGVLGPLSASFLLIHGTEKQLLKRMTIVVMSSATVAAVALLVMTSTESVEIARMSLGISIFALSAVSPMIVTPIQILVPNAVRGRFHAILSFVFTIIAGGMGPTLVGLVTDGLFKDESRLGSSLLLVGCASAALGIVLMLLSRRAIERLPFDPSAGDA